MLLYACSLNPQSLLKTCTTDSDCSSKKACVYKSGTSGKKKCKKVPSCCNAALAPGAVRAANCTGCRSTPP